jgi:glyceraldehyde 3-phosphate dehydrogenase
MPTTHVALMGFGRIGRNLFRVLHQHQDIQVAAICDLATPATIEYLLRFDTTLGRFPGEVSVHDDKLHCDGREVVLVPGRTQDPLPWKDLGIDVVIDATSRPVSRAEAEQHLEWGADRVLLCTPATDPPATVVMGLNHESLTAGDRIVSAASCTANCAAPILKILGDAFGVQRAFLSTVHAYTNAQRLADVPAEDMRSGRAAAENIIPQPADSADVVGRLLPELQGKLSGSTMNVPVADGSVVDLVCWHDKEVTKDAINEVVRDAAHGAWKGILAYEDAPIVSSDVLGQTASGTFDSIGTMAMGNVSKTLTWFENGWGYAHRVVELIQHTNELRKEAA